MKKFLFTLAALLMAGSLCAEEYLYVEGVELTQAQLGTTIEVPVKAHFDYYVSAWELDLTLPEGMTIASWEEGEDLTLSYVNQNGKTKSLEAGVTTQDNKHFICITSATQGNYYQNEDGAWTYAGPVMWEPGEYAEMLILHIAVAADFAGGNFVVETQPACGTDVRPEVQEMTCPKGQDNVKTAEFTVEGGSEPEVTEKPVITSENDDEAQQTTVTATGNGHICLYQDDILVAEGEGSASFVIAYGEMEEEYGFSATAQEEGKEVSEYALATIYVPAAEVVPPTPEDLTGEIVFGELNEETGEIAVTYNGPEEVTLTATYAEVTRGGETTVTLPDYGTYEITAVASAEGFNDKEAKKTVTWEEPVTPPEPEVTEKPVITYENDDEAQVTHVTATGNGHICLYVEDILVAEGEGTATYDIAYSELEEEYGVSATAQEEGKEVSEYALETVYVPGKEVGPEDPHDTGVWLVVLTQDGEEVWNEMDLTEDHYSYFLSLDYDTYGTYGYDAGEDRPDVEMYVVVDGVVMGAPEAGQVVDIAEPANNILEETENNYVLEEALGRIYQMGVYTNSDGEKYLVASPMPDYTGIDELLNGKTVAGVRYFNMAGQEMQEANGVTIVVTTYTDGTTSAVKVIK